MNKLYKSTNNKIIAGVCGGISELYGWDVSIIRLITVALSLFSGAGIILYIVAALILPEGSDVADVVDVDDSDIN